MTDDSFLSRQVSGLKQFLAVRYTAIGASFASFVVVGAIATAIQYAILIVTVEGLAWSPPVASTAGFCISSVVNYLLNYHFTFRSRARHSVAALRFVVVAVVGLAINGGAMLAFQAYGGLNYVLAQVLATGLTLLWTFGASRAWTFRSDGRASVR